MGVNSLPKTVTRQRRDCDLNPRPSVPESSTLTTRLQATPLNLVHYHNLHVFVFQRDSLCDTDFRLLFKHFRYRETGTLRVSRYSNSENLD